MSGSTNIQGEKVQKLDVVANEIFVNALISSGKVCALVSEELEKPIFLRDAKGKYIVMFDPLDGSSNLDHGITVGTIFGIYQSRKGLNEFKSEKELLESDLEIISAGYAIYGSFTMLVLSTGSGLNGFTLDPSFGEFILTNPSVINRISWNSTKLNYSF